MSPCVFCQIENERIVRETKLFVVMRDLFPVTDLHTLIIPKRHVESYFNLNASELGELHHIIIQQQSEILERDQTVSGFNIGVNVGEDAGQTIFHCHVHLIPRRKGDTRDPRGGVRGVIPDKQSY